MYQRSCIWWSCILGACFSIFGSAQAQNLTVLYSFKGGFDGAGPEGTLIRDASGKLYGTTYAGGGTCDGVGCGTVFRIAPSGAETVLHRFNKKGIHERFGNPLGGVIADKTGNLFGTTEYAGNLCLNSTVGCGTVFKIDPDGIKTTLYAFKGGSDGLMPYAGLVADKAGNLYGTTEYGGGGTGCGDDYGCGIVFKVKPDGTESVLHAFAGGSDGEEAVAGLIIDKDGNLFGTTAEGGQGACDAGFGCGTVFKIAPEGTKTVLYAFKGGSDGANPVGGLTADKSGNLYGTTLAGGSANCGGETGCGTVFKLTPGGSETVLYAFQPGSDGAYPRAGVILDKRGNLYGTTTAGGADVGCNDDELGCGTIFMVSADGTEKILYAFQGASDGEYPYGGLVADTFGNLYGTTEEGGNGCTEGYGCGTVFMLAK